MRKRKIILLLGLVIMLIAVTGCARRTTGKVDGVEVRVEIEGEGRVAGLSEGYNYVQKGSVVSLRAIPAEGYEFYRWEGQVAEPKESTTSLKATRNTEIKAIFAKDVDLPIVYPEMKGINKQRIDGLKYEFEAVYDGDFESITWKVLDSKGQVITEGKGDPFTYEFRSKMSGKAVSVIAIGKFYGKESSHTKTLTVKKLERPEISSIKIRDLGNKKLEFTVEEYSGKIDEFYWEIISSSQRLITVGKGKTFTHQFQERDVITAISVGKYWGGEVSHSKAYEVK